ncbi:DsbA family protein [Sphingobium sp. CR28]|uniref:DsbA family protein n=1 Tax=Sphingobium sp. CR28 TaxID=3400272 RepID=UPI003FEF2A7D
MIDGKSAKPGLSDWRRAGGRLVGALFASTGPALRRRGGRALLLAGVSAALLGGGAVAGYAAAGAGDVPPAERARIEAVVREYILAHPEIIPEAIERLKDQRLAGAIDENRKALETPYRGAWEGAAEPEVVLVEFFDYACGYCRASLPDIARLLKENPKLRVVYRELPVITEGSADAARVSLLAAEEGKYPRFHAAMYAAGGVDKAKVLAAAKAAGIDEAKAKAALASDSRDGEISGNVRLAQSLQGSGTPLFVVGDKVMEGAVGYEALQKAINEARKKG